MTKDQKPSAGQQQNEGEGNRTAARRYDRAQQDFVKSGKVEEAAQAAQPEDEAEAGELRRAEDEGRSHAKR